jgi:hypothetical protein
VLDFDFQVTEMFLFLNFFLLHFSTQYTYEHILVTCTIYNVPPYVFIGAEVRRLTDMWLTVCTFSIS